MKILLFSILISVLGCGPVKKSASDVPAPQGSRVISDSLPVCVRVLVEKFQSEPVTNPPRSVYRYIYQGKKVYYVGGVCCDQYSDLYNDSCRIMGHPDGGITGRGDGKIKDFGTEKSDEKLMWADTRTK